MFTFFFVNVLRNSLVRITEYVNYIFSYEHAYYLRNCRLCHALENVPREIISERVFSILYPEFSRGTVALGY